MPRPLDTTLEKRLLEAARNLWRSGERCLTIRALARAANSHVPAIYSRFHNRQDIIRLLIAQFEQELAASVTTADSVETATELYLEFAINHPNEYETLFTSRGATSNKGATCSDDDLGPVFRWLQRKLSESLLLDPQENTSLALAVWSLWHGTAALLLQCAASTSLADSARSAAIRGVKTLLQDARYRDGREAEGVAACYPV